MKDYFLILGIRPDATTGDVKNAYSEKLSRYHPDSNTTQISKEQMLLVIEAHSVLSERVLLDIYRREYKYCKENECSVETYSCKNYALQTEMYNARKYSREKLRKINFQIFGKETKEMTLGGIDTAKRDIKSGAKMYLVWVAIAAALILFSLLMKR